MRVTGLFFVCMLFACGQATVDVPKPRSYHRIYFPEHAYQRYQGEEPFTFEYPLYAAVEKDQDKNAQRFWNNLTFSQFNARVHLTYHGVFSKENYHRMTEDARKLAMKHTIKANSIDQKFINYPDKKVYGLYYLIEGNTASSVQFFLTDSAKHYFRGALYFYEQPQYDSLQPVINFIKKDIDHLIETFNWKK